MFDAVSFEREQDRLPTLDEVFAIQRENTLPTLLLVGEPRESGPGKELRSRIHLPSDHPNAIEADPWIQAQHYANDRDSLYQELVIPFLRAGGHWVIQMRGLMSSFVFQAVALAEQRAISVHEAIALLLEFEGNTMEYTHAPQHLILLDVDSTTAIARRPEHERDTFERNQAVMQRLRSDYLHPDIHAAFSQKGTKIHQIDASLPREEVRSCLARLVEYHIVSI